jgi:tetratricopeptide (TPR) repeat protein
MKVNCRSLLFLLAVILITAGCAHNKTIEGFSAAHWSEIGRQAIDAKHWNEALNAYNKAIDLNPNDASAYNNRGLAYDNLDKDDLAIADYDKAVELNPEYGDAFKNLAKTYGRRGYYKQAILFYDRVIRLNPKDADAYYNRGNAYDKIGDSRLANQDLKIAAQLGNIFAQKSLKEKGITW